MNWLHTRWNQIKIDFFVPSTHESRECRAGGRCFVHSVLEEAVPRMETRLIAQGHQRYHQTEGRTANCAKASRGERRGSGGSLPIQGNVHRRRGSGREHILPLYIVMRPYPPPLLPYRRVLRPWAAENSEFAFMAWKFPNLI